MLPAHCGLGNGIVANATASNASIAGIAGVARIASIAGDSGYSGHCKRALVAHSPKLMLASKLLAGFFH